MWAAKANISQYNVKNITAPPPRPPLKKKQQQQQQKKKKKKKKTKQKKQKKTKNKKKKTGNGRRIVKARSVYDMHKTDFACVVHKHDLKTNFLIARYIWFCLCWGFTAQSTHSGHVERGQFT